MLAVLFSMLAILALCGFVVLYAAFPARGQQVPGLPWLGEAMKRTVDAVPTIDRR